MKEASNKLLTKAGRAIRAAEQLLAGGDSEFAIGRAYYAMFYAQHVVTWRAEREGQPTPSLCP